MKTLLLLCWLTIANARLLIISARGGKCFFPEGDYLMSRFQKALTDYANQHGYTFSFRTNTAIPTLAGHWNKIGQLLDIFNGPFEQYEWMLWVDNDTLVCNPLMPLNLSQYANYDFVIHGNPEAFKAQKIDMYQALNSGVMLLKVNKASEMFLKKIAEIAQWSKDEKQGKLEDRYLNFENIQDQAAITYFVHQSMLGNAEFQLKIFIEPQPYLNGYWEGFQGSKIHKLLFKHWAGCKFCERSSQNEQHRQRCIADFLQDYDRIYSNRQRCAVGSLK